MVKVRNAPLDFKTERLHANLIDADSVTQKKGRRPKMFITEVAKAAGTEPSQTNPKKSIRKYQQESGVSYGPVKQLLKEII